MTRGDNPDPPSHLHPRRDGPTPTASPLACHVLAVAEDDDDGVTVIDDEFLAVLGQGDSVLGGVTRSWL
ncbi:hypothetical protein [Candidatus Mycobacterium methanotrophicum]|uniref:hypothetical protein n=1 Tax=Candidatus Mycobacterium methanotrophicum TaxID=2943498 RepID=UPI001C5A1ADD|nr:hypothetical protein [Candidatus Mycobacterium methanotrophicum]